MSDDIVDRLRDARRRHGLPLFDEAADEIVRLQKEIDLASPHEGKVPDPGTTGL
jgi:hypothetical protein